MRTNRTYFIILLIIFFGIGFLVGYNVCLNNKTIEAYNIMDSDMVFCK